MSDAPYASHPGRPVTTKENGIRMMLLAMLASAMFGGVIGVLLLVAPLGAQAHYRLANSRPCVGALFQPNTDYGAVGVRASHMNCRDARRVARRFGFLRDRRPFGFHCITRGRGNGDSDTGWVTPT